MNDFFGNQLSVGDFVISVGVSEAALKFGVIQNIDTVKKKISVLNCGISWRTGTWVLNSKSGAYTNSKRMLKVDSSQVPRHILNLFP